MRQIQPLVRLPHSYIDPNWLSADPSTYPPAEAPAAWELWLAESPKESGHLDSRGTGLPGVLVILAQGTTVENPTILNPFPV